MDDTFGSKVVKTNTDCSKESASKGAACEPNQLLPGEPNLTAESHSYLTSDVTSSELNLSNQAHGHSDLPSISNEATSTDDLTVFKKNPNVQFAASPDAADSPASSKRSNNALAEVDNNLAVAETSEDQTTENISPAEPENSVESSEEIANRGCCPEHRGILGYFRISMMYARESKFLMPFQFLLLYVSVSSGFMGAKYMEKCPVSPAIPLLLFMMGMIGTIIICARIYYIFKKALFPHSDWSGQVRYGLASGLLMISLMYTTELTCFFIAVPSFKKGSWNYCHETFYSFVFYINYISIGLLILLLLLHCPGPHPCASIVTI
ncbi:hypothetical protein JTE90_022454 [Oedothorax gibbosus]|uniref:Uncharacterized protein n=1 Tax=Oedothorax gibbosus TaxID=931172 RepID=A0AAV6TXT3_9ARAC|nr:hypothetical protein JTE90_022454 [Oedothorax gibbosus]